MGVFALYIIGHGTNAIFRTIGFLNCDLLIRKLVLMSRDFIHVTY